LDAIAKFLRAIIGILTGRRKASDETLEQFKQKWNVNLTLSPLLPQGITGKVLPWEEDWLRQLDEALNRLPRKMINAAGVECMFVAKNLRRAGGRPLDGVSHLQQIGLDASLFRQPQDDPDLRVPLLDTTLLEEMAHAWDRRLRREGSPDSSEGVKWLDVECDSILYDAAGNPSYLLKPFHIPNRKDYDLISEDWASALVWFVFQPEELKQISIERYEFVKELFEKCLPQ
jgi:hypothetical protein